MRDKGGRGSKTLKICVTSFMDGPKDDKRNVKHSLDVIYGWSQCNLSPHRSWNSVYVSFDTAVEQLSNEAWNSSSCLAVREQIFPPGYTHYIL